MPADGDLTGLARLDLGTLLLSLLLSPETVLFTLAAVALGAVFVIVGEVGGAAGEAWRVRLG